MTPPWPCDRRTWKRVTGTGAISRSVTSTPPAFSPAITARLRARAARLESRDVVTVDPFFMVVA